MVPCVTSAQTQGLSFGEIADEFDRIRPGYPDQLVGDVLSYVGGEAVQAIEVGAGTGKATTAFTARGVQVTAVEPDGQMAALLAQRQPAVRIVSATFEGFTPEQPVDLLYCAQAWHWTDPDQRWQRAAAALKPGGTIALFWNSDRLLTEDAQKTLREVVETHAPQLLFVFNDEPEEDDLTASWPGPDMAALTDFTGLTTRLYRWERTLSGDDYLAYLGTRTAYRMLPRPLLDTLFVEASARLPETVTLAVETALYLARRA
jgi:SAM-dependent methyltransferase